MSQFLKNNDDYVSEFAERLDFDRAVKLPSGGSICDIYRTRWQRREVFVKRLKEEFRAKPLYLDALDKEFDIGAGLQHPSLPRYLEFHREYIVMDYIDGVTLADMINQCDPWLANPKHVKKLVQELVDVVDYLHRHNVVHCDIKLDNIMITSNGKNLVLVDFDKSYSDALNDTSGHPGKYGLPIDKVGKTAIDFHGIGLVAEKLYSAGFKFGQHKELVKACYSEDVDCEKLREILSPSTSEPMSDRFKLFVALGILSACFVIIFIGALLERNDKPSAESMDETAKEKNIEMEPSETVEAVEITQSQTPIVTNTEPKAITQEDLHADAKAKATQLDKRITPYFNELQAGLDKLGVLKNDSTLTGQQLLDSIRTVVDKADEYIAEAFEILNEMYPGLTDREAWRIMSYSKAYTGYSRRYAVEGKEYRQEYERRFEKEGTQPQ